MVERRPFAVDALREAPRSGGVYVLWDADVVLFIGHVAANGHSIHSRLMEHYVCQRAPFEATHFTWETCADPETRAGELIRDYYAANQDFPRWNTVA